MEFLEEKVEIKKLIQTEKKCNYTGKEINVKMINICPKNGCKICDYKFCSFSK